ncbi:MAG TPA: hypothetical protein VFN28_02955 [Amaricoccus sp.]|nr:hypothetical protein [Amaricoccus sp.]
MKSLVAASVALFLSLAPANAAVLVSFQESGADVIAELAGTLDITGLEAGSPAGASVSGVSPLEGLVSTNTPGAAQRIFRGTITGPSNFGPGGPGFADSQSGDSVFFQPLVGFLAMPIDFVAGGVLSASMTFLNQSFASLGMTAGDYVYTLPADTFTVRLVPALIPLPAGLPLLLGAVGLLALVRPRRA